MKKLIDDELRELVYAVSLELMQQYFPEGKLAGKYYYFLNPYRNDNRLGSCVMQVRGNMMGRWKDFASGDRGDIFDLISKATGTPLVQIAKEARSKFIGMGA